MINTKISGVHLVKLKRYEDARGFFFEACRASWIGAEHRWVQSNISRSSAGVVRGLHFHHKQTDYWVVVEGHLQVALVDVRKGSSTHRAAICLDLDSADPHALVIPPGVLHGYRAIIDTTMMYLLDHEYDATDEHAVRWNDSALGLPKSWYQMPPPILSARDAAAPPLAKIEET